MMKGAEIIGEEKDVSLSDEAQFWGFGFASRMTTPIVLSKCLV